MREAFSAILKEDYQIITASGGKEAIRKAELDRPDLILLDINLLDISGLDVLSEVKKSAPHIKVIIVSGCDDEEIFLKAKNSGAYACFPKPPNFNHMRMAICSALDPSFIRD